MLYIFVVVCLMQTLGSTNGSNKFKRDDSSTPLPQGSQGLDLVNEELLKDVVKCKLKMNSTDRWENNKRWLI